MRKLPIENATDAQVAAFCTTVLQLDLTGADTRAKLMALLGPAWPNDFILVEGDEAGDYGDVIEPEVDVDFLDVNDDGPLVEFKILPTDMPGGKDPAYPSVNGRMLVMQRNMLIRAPYAYYHALQNAKIGAPHEIETERGKPPTIVYSDVTNYPVSEVRLPSQRAVDEWRQRRGGRLLGDNAQAA